jgi:hypothetical protein
MIENECNGRKLLVISDPTGKIAEIDSHLPTGVRAALTITACLEDDDESCRVVLKDENLIKTLRFDCDLVCECVRDRSIFEFRTELTRARETEQNGAKQLFTNKMQQRKTVPTPQEPRIKSGMSPRTVVYSC